MDRVILIKYGELTTKKGNRNFFIKKLLENLNHKLKNYDIKIVKDISRMCIEFKDEELEEIKTIISNTFGIYKYHIADIVDTNNDAIKDKVLEVAKSKTFKTFKIEVKRSDKTFEYTSLEYAPVLGGVVLKNISNISVDVHNPDLLLSVEIKPYKSYVYTATHYAVGGYPVGAQSKGMLMLSGGIDSPVAGYLAMKRGIKIEAVYFEAIPHTSIDARNKVIDLTKKLTSYTNQIKLHIVPFTEIQEAIYKNCDPSYAITIMRRMMYRIMDRLAKRNKALVIINGESIGQVASQTLTSMSVINNVTNMPIIRPVACLDKLEIIDIARKIDTYSTSILPFEDCCTVFVPKHPVINPSLEDSIKMEEKFDYNSMINTCLGMIKTLKIKDVMDEEFEELL